jgi:glucose/arabinose dehydrogenase
MVWSLSCRLLLTLISLLIVSLSALAATLPTGFTETAISGISSPTAMEIAPDGRIFVCQQGGSLRVIKNGTLLTTPFLTLTVDANGERGLLGVAFDPNFASNNFIYVYYTVTSNPRHNRVSRFTANGDVVLAGSELPILDLDSLSGATNHNGGAIHFGPDGKLYVAVGENANGANSQTLSNRLGKVLRINSDGTIPTDNPFFNTAMNDNRSIWALGLRNPFTFAFQPGTGRLFINDVGQSTWEEINDGIAGSNYGWPTTEGVTTNPSFRSPLFAYGHGSSGTTGCAIAGGSFYNPTTVNFPVSFVGKYFFADLCSGWIRVFDPTTSTAAPFATGINQPVDLKVAADGSLYYLSIGSGAVFRVRFSTPPTPPTITQHPANQTVMQGQPATFMVSASGDAPLSFQWQRNQANIPGATASSYTLAAAALIDTGAKFRCVVTNSAGSATSNEATLTVNAPAPILITEELSDVAIALDSVTLVRDPFALTNIFNFSTDQRTRLILFGMNLDLLPGETASAVTAQAEDAGMNVFPLVVEDVAKVPGFDWLSQVVVRLPNNTPTGQPIFVSVRLRGQSSNKARVRMR